MNVRDSGEFVPNLIPSSFRVKVGGQEAAVSSVSTFAGPIRLILVLDASGSMRETSARWATTKDLVEAVIASSPASMKLALLVFNTHTLRKIDFGHSRNELSAAIAQLPEANGQTALWNSLLEASEMFGDPAAGDAVLVISDFGDDVSKVGPQKIRKAFIARGIRMFAVGLRMDRYFVSEEERENLDAYYNLLKMTGGNSTEQMTKFRKDLPTLLKQLFDEMGRVYIFSIKPFKPSTKPERLEILIPKAGGKRQDRIVLAYPQLLFPCIP